MYNHKKYLKLLLRNKKLHYTITYIQYLILMNCLKFVYMGFWVLLTRFFVRFKVLTFYYFYNSCSTENCQKIINPLHIVFYFKGEDEVCSK